MNSISTRLLIATTLVLASFVALTALSVQRSVHSKTEQAQRDRMEGLVYGILGAADLDDNGELLINEFALPDGRLRQPYSGLSARIYDATNRLIWQSESAIAITENINPVMIGRWRFRRQENETEISDFSLRFGFSWIAPDNSEKEFNVLLLEDAGDHREQLKTFDQNLWTSLLTSALLLLLLQLFVLMWGLKPLGKLTLGLQRIQRGEQEDLETRRLPQELRPIAFSLNTLLHSERNRRARYKNVIHDLAHSLKTPLAIMQNLSQDKAVDETTRRTLGDQSSRMRDIVAYHIRRASVGGAQPLGAAVAVKALVVRLSASLRKVYSSRKIRFDIRLDPKCRIRADESDIMEIFGNILENACKYGATRIRVSYHTDTERQLGIFDIEDNGPGFPDDISSGELLKRGTRADTRVDGQGIGLAVCNELVTSYDGKLVLGSSESLGGACVSIYLSATI